MDADREFERLERHLRDERQALLSGQISKLADLADAQAAAADTLPYLASDQRRLAQIKAAAERNADLAQAARAGVQAAMARLAAIRKSADPIGSYSADGGRAEIGAARPLVERKV